MKPRGAILVRILLLAILNSLCTNSLSLTTTNSLPGNSCICMAYVFNN